MDGDASLAGIVGSGFEAGVGCTRISLGALIISLGLLVDDAMITIEMMVSQLEAGVDREHSATHAWVTTAFPMLTGTLVTVAGFVPIGFAKSGAGEYCYSLFAVIAVALLASWIVAVMFAPVIGVRGMDDEPDPRAADKIRLFDAGGVGIGCVFDPVDAGAATA